MGRWIVFETKFRTDAYFWIQTHLKKLRKKLVDKAKEYGSADFDNNFKGYCLLDINTNNNYK